MSTDYRNMSDFEINGLIAKNTQKVGDFTQARGLTFIHEYGSPISDFGALCLGWKEFDPCNNPADAWPIIVENKLWLRELYGTWQVRGFPTHNPNDIITQSDTNPLRSAMIVFLKMQESKDAS